MAINNILRTASILQEQQKFSEAKELLLENLDSNQHPIFYFSLGFCEVELENLDSAEIYFDKAIALDEFYYDSFLGKAQIRICRGDDAGAIPYFEAAKNRLQQHYQHIPDLELHNQISAIEADTEFCRFKTGHNKIKFVPPVKRNSKLADNHFFNVSNPKTLLVGMEEGIGEQIAVSQIFKKIENLAETVIIMCDEKLIPIFQKTFDDIIFVGRKTSPSQIKYDAFIEMATVTNLLLKSVEDFKETKFPVLKVNKDTASKFKDRYYDGRPIVGISWCSPLTSLNYSKKNIPLESFDSLINNTDYNFISLQYGAANKDIDRLGYDIEKREDIDIFDDIESYFSLVSICDAVVGSSSNLHSVAGSLGVPSFNLSHSGLAKPWLWRAERNGQSIWFPSVNIIDTKDGSTNWKYPVTQVKKQLRELLDAN